MVMTASTALLKRDARRWFRLANAALFPHDFIIVSSPGAECFGVFPSPQLVAAGRRAVQAIAGLGCRFATGTGRFSLLPFTIAWRNSRVLSLPSNASTTSGRTAGGRDDTDSLGLRSRDGGRAVDAARSRPGRHGRGLYILNCGEGVAGDISRWSPGVNVGKSMDFVDNCYLIKHAQGWMMWDTGLADAIANLPEGQRPADPRMTHWRRPKTLASQLEQLGVKPSDIKYVAVSHTHPDHIGNVELFPQSMLLVQKAEYEWPNPLGVGRFKPEHPGDQTRG